MYDDEYRAARKKVVRRLVLRLTFLVNLAFFSLVLLLLLRAHASMMGTAFFALIWGAGLLFHASLAFNLFGGLIDRATRQELERGGFKEKPKRHRLEVGEDGEVMEIIEDEETAPSAGDLRR